MDRALYTHRSPRDAAYHEGFRDGQAQEFERRKAAFKYLLEVLNSGRPDALDCARAACTQALYPPQDQLSLFD
jgi:hypothetical protein